MCPTRGKNNGLPLVTFLLFSRFLHSFLLYLEYRYDPSCCPCKSQRVLYNSQCLVVFDFRYGHAYCWLAQGRQMVFLETYSWLVTFSRRVYSLSAALATSAVLLISHITNMATFIYSSFHLSETICWKNKSGKII